MIEVRALTKRYRDFVAIEGLDFDVQPGEVVGFLGPNGAGKTTTMRILTGYMPATSGSVRIAGLDVFEEPLKVKRKVGYLPEVPPVYLDLTVRGCLEFTARLKKISGRDRKAELDRVAELAGIGHVLPRLVRNVSKGYRQRLGLAQALLGDPELLVLDEPTVGLDPIQIEQVRRVITQLAEEGGRTILLSTHILSEVRATCERVVMLAGGHIVANQPIEALESEFGSLERAFVQLAVA